MTINSESVRQAIKMLVRDKKDQIALLSWLARLEAENDKERIPAGMEQH